MLVLRSCIPEYITCREVCIWPFRFQAHLYLTYKHTLLYNFDPYLNTIIPWILKKSLHQEIHDIIFNNYHTLKNRK